MIPFAKSGLFALFACLAPSALDAGSAPKLACPAISGKDSAKLVDYVQKKFKIPPARGITLSSSSAVGPSCFRKLEFIAKDPTSGYRVTLFASPDLQFLSKELLDTSIDPVEEERRQARELMAGLNAGGFPVLGPKNAPVTVVVFSDFQCPYCARLAKLLKTEVLPQEGGKMRLVFRNYPLSFHSWARPAAEITTCAADQRNDAFWRLHDFIFDHQSDFTPENVRQKLTEEASRIPGFDQARLSRCLAEKRVAGRIDEDIAFASKADVSGTPTVFVNGFRVAAVSSAVQLRSIIREQSQASQGKPWAMLH